MDTLKLYRFSLDDSGHISDRYLVARSHRQAMQRSKFKASEYPSAKVTVLASQGPADLQQIMERGMWDDNALTVEEKIEVLQDAKAQLDEATEQNRLLLRQIKTVITQLN